MRPTKITTIAASSAVNSGVSVRKVPAVTVYLRLRASEPASASAGMISKNRPIHMARPSVELYQRVLPASPANADPLLCAAEVNA